MGGISTVYSEDNHKKKYIASLVNDGTAFLPLILKGDELVLYQNYYKDKQQLIENQKDPLLKQDLRIVAKKGINNCGVEKGTVRNIATELNKRLKELITDPAFAKLSKIHESKFKNAVETHIDLGKYELAITFDG
eukprot:203695_1